MSQITEWDLKLALLDCLRGKREDSARRDALRAATVLPAEDCKAALVAALRSVGQT